MPNHPSLIVDRNALYDRLDRRNKIVAFLRLAVPGLGLVLAVGLIFQIVLANLAGQIVGLDFQIDIGQLVFNAPKYTGVLADGSSYEVVAQTARVALDDPDIIDLVTMVMSTDENDPYSFVARAENARWQFSAQKLVVTGLMTISDSNGVTGKLINSVVDLRAQILTANGPVQFDFENGSSLEAEGLIYDAGTGVWDFSQVTYRVPADGGVL